MDEGSVIPLRIELICAQPGARFVLYDLRALCNKLVELFGGGAVFKLASAAGGVVRLVPPEGEQHYYKAVHLFFGDWLRADWIDPQGEFTTGRTDILLASFVDLEWGNRDPDRAMRDRAMRMRARDQTRLRVQFVTSSDAPAWTMKEAELVKDALR